MEEELLYLPHPISKKHCPMKMSMRAAQFAPFAALIGYEEMVEETMQKMEEEMK